MLRVKHGAHRLWQICPHRGLVARKVEQDSRLRVQAHDSFLFRLQYDDAARQRIQNLLQRDPHAFVLGHAASQRAIAFFQLHAQLGDFIVQLAMCALQPVGRRNESAEGIGQVILGDARIGCDAVHWTQMRARQHLPTWNARPLPKQPQFFRSISNVTVPQPVVEFSAAEIERMSR